MIQIWINSKSPVNQGFFVAFDRLRRFKVNFFWIYPGNCFTFRNQTIRPLNTKKTVLALGAVALTYIVLQGMRFAKNVSVKFSNIRIKGSFFQPEIFCTATVINPTGFTVTIDAIKGQIFYQQQYIANIESVDKISIVANQTVSTDLKILPTISGTLNIIQQFIGRSIANEFYFIGHLYISGIPISVNQKIGE